MKLHIKCIIVGCLFLFAFTTYSQFVKRGGGKSVDFAVTVKLQERIDKSSRLRTTRLVGEIMEGSMFFASPLMTTVGVLIVTVFAGLKRKKYRFIVLLIPLLFGLMTLGELYGKSVVHHPAPPFFMLKNPTTIFPKYQVLEDYSYPSGHAARSIFLAVTVWFLTIKKRKLFIGFVLGLYVGLVTLSKMYLGHHWLSDMIGGILLGSGFGLLTSIAFLPYNRKAMSD